MNPERWRQIERICHSALERPSRERAGFLEIECRGDEDLRFEVQSLLRRAASAGTFLDEPAAAAARQILMSDDSSTRFASRDEASVDDLCFPPGEICAGRYRIVSLIGRGGMGEVYRADDLKLGQSVALKFLPPSLSGDRSLQERLLDEVRIARQVSHPSVCRVHDIGETIGRLFLSMEYVDGENLASLLRRIGRLPTEKALEVARQLCAGLAAAHKKGVVHRDLKPANIMIDSRGLIRIMDFGIATSLEVRHTAKIAGTAAYMAPEQVLGKPVTVRSDLYALGLVLFEIFTGVRALQADSVEERLLMLDARPPNASSLARDVDPSVERLIQRCVDVDPLNRPASAAAVAASLPGGGDSLTAAVIAGRIAPPEIVAAAGDIERLRPSHAWFLLLAALLGMITVVWAGREDLLVRQAALDKPPEALEERAKQIISTLGYPARPRDSECWFTLDRDFTPGKAVLFVYRQSPRDLRPQNLFHRVLERDPAPDVPGMVTVVLDSRGSLRRFAAVPPERAQPNGSPPAPDWLAPFSQAGLDVTRFRPAEAVWTPASAYDVRAAWEGDSPALSNEDLQVTAAAFLGKLVEFEIRPPSRNAIPESALELGRVERSRASEVFLVIAIISLGITALILARQNLRLGVSDRSGALRVAVYSSTLGVSSLLLGGHHVPDLEVEFGFVVGAIAWTLFWGGFVWVAYLALEPFVRRWWPGLLISWTRLLAGRIGDPLVGRDVLIGILVGIGFRAINELVFAFARKLNLSRPLPWSGALDTLSSPRLFLARLLYIQSDALMFALGGLLLILLLRIILRKQWLAIMVWMAGTASLNLLAGSHVAPLLVFVDAASIAGLAALVLLRFGLVAATASLVFMEDIAQLPVTLDLSSWYGGRSLIVLTMIAAVAIWSFRTALGGRPVFAATVLND